MDTLFTFFLQITILLIGIVTTAQGLATNNRRFNSLKFRLFRVAEANALVKSIWLPTGTKTLICSGNSPGWKGWRY
jgi:hypothetical protein